MPFADKRSKIKKPISIALGLVFFGFVGIIGGITYIRHLPVDYDAGACSGGYAAFIFDKYKEELVKKYYDGMETIPTFRLLRLSKEHRQQNGKVEPYSYNLIYSMRVLYKALSVNESVLSVKEHGLMPMIGAVRLFKSDDAWSGDAEALPNHGF